MNKFFKRLALLLAVLMIVSMMPVQLFADNSVTGEEQSNGTGEASGNSNAVAKIGNTGYESLADAIANATPDTNGVITYKISGKAEISGADQWISFVKMLKVLQLLSSWEGVDVDVSFENLTLSHPNGIWVNDLGHATNYFACMVRNSGHTVTYTNCTFPNGACNNQYGKTVFDGCKFTNATSGKYNFWNYGGNTEIKNSTFTGVRGIKTYNEGTLAVAPTVKIENTTFEGLTEKAAIVASKATDITLDNVSATGCTKGFFQKDIEYSGEKTTIEANGSAISGNFNITAEKGAAAAKEEFNITGGTFKGEVSSDYLADGFEVKDNGDGTYGVAAKNYVAAIGDAYYSTLQEAIDAATRNSIVTLLADTKENVIISTPYVTLDLNGHTLNGSTGERKPALTVTARVTVKDSSTAQTGTIMREDTAENSGVSSHYVIDIQGNGWLTFESGIVKNDSGNSEGKGASLVRVGDDSVAKYPGFNIKGGSFTQDNFIVIKVDRGDLFLNGGTLNSANSYAVENWLKATIKGGTVNGAVSSWTYSGGSNSTLEISGGTVNGNVESVSYDGSADKKAKVSITGGTVNGTLSTKIYDSTTTPDKEIATIEVTGGTFSSDPTAYLVESSSVTKNSDGTYGVAKAYLAKVGDTSYYTMDEAFKAQTASGKPIVMLRDYTTRGTFNSGSINRTVDLNGFTWTYTGTDDNDAAFEINYPNATLTVKNGKVVSASMAGLIPSAVSGTITYDESSLVFDGVVITANGHSGIETNGNNTNDTVTLKNSTLNVPNGFGIYFPSSGKLIIENSKITAKTMGVQVCSGALSISGANTAITVTGDAVEKTENDGAIQDGAAISIVNRTGYKGLEKVEIENGKFTSKAGNAALKAYNWENKTESAFTASEKVAVSGGTFSSEVSEDLCAEGFIPTKNADDTYGVKAGKYVAQIGSTKYETLADAIRLAAKGKTITLLADVTEDVVITANKSITLDLNGKTLNGGTGNTKATITNYGTITITDSSAEKTGTIKRDDNGTEGETSYYVIRNLGTMTIEQANIINNSGYKKTNPSGSMVGSSLICNGDDDAYSAVLNIKGGTIRQDNFIAIKNGSSATLNVTGGKITSKHSAVQNWCNANITGGELNGQLWTDSWDSNSTGNTVMGGDAKFTGEIVVDITGSIVPKFEITGGTLDVTNWRITTAAANAGAKPAVSGGTFKHAVPEEYCADGFIPTKNADDTYGVKEGKYVAQIGNVKYETLEEAYAAAKNGDTITLLEDCKSDRINLEDKSVTVVLNGKTLTSTAAYGVMFCAKNGNKITIDGTVEGSKLVGTLMITAETDGHIEVNGGTYENSQYCPIYVNGAVSSENSTVTVKNAIINATNSNSNQDMGCGVYLAGYSTSVFENCTITAPITGIEIRAGKLTLNNCVVTGGNGEVKTKANGNGTTVTNAALAISQHTTKKPIEVIINGGTFNGTAAVYQTDVQDTGSVDVKIAVNDGTFNGEILGETDGAIAISGGKFKFKVDDKYFADKLACSATPNADGYYTVKDHPITGLGLSIGESLTLRITVDESYKNGKLKYTYIGAKDGKVHSGIVYRAEKDKKGNWVFRISDINAQRADVIYTVQYVDESEKEVGSAKEVSILKYCEGLVEQYKNADEAVKNSVNTLVCKLLNYSAAAMDYRQETDGGDRYNNMTWGERATALRKRTVELCGTVTDYAFEVSHEIRDYGTDKNAVGVNGEKKVGIEFSDKIRLFFNINYNENYTYTYNGLKCIPEEVSGASTTHRIYVTVAPFAYDSEHCIEISDADGFVYEIAYSLDNALESLAEKYSGTAAGNLAKATYEYCRALTDFAKYFK